MPKLDRHTASLLLSRKSAVLACVATVGLLVSASAADITSGLVAYWPLNDVNRNTATDYSGNGHTANLQGHPVWTIGKTDAALRFVTSNDSVSTSSGVVDTSQSFSVAAWVQIENLANWASAVTQDGNSVSGFFLQYTNPNAGADGAKFAFSMLSADSSSAPSIRATSLFGPIANTWYHLTGVHDAGSNQIKLYVNGALQSVRSVPPSWNAAGGTIIGRAKFNGGPTDFWPGRIEDVRIYNRALADQDAQALYSSAPQTSPVRPPAVPLVVRGPYTNTWLASNSAPGTWPTFWNGNVKAITGIARIDGVAYTFFGAPANTGAPMQQTQLEVTPTESRYVFSGGGITVYVTFLSPVEATDLRRLSMPFSYIFAQAQTNDGNAHNVSLYFDISGEWAHGTDTALITWGKQQVTHGGGTLTVHTVTPSAPQALTETNDYPSWGTVIWATNQQQGVTFQSGADQTVRGLAVTQGQLNNTIDTNKPRAINDHWPVFAFNFALGNIGGQPTAPIELALGHVRSPAVSYLGRNIPSLWKSYWSSWQNMLGFAYDDAVLAVQRAKALDESVSAEATQSNGPHYAALCALALRQAFGGVELVGTANTPWLFLKEISSSGNVSTVDVIYPSIPVFLHTNPTLLRLLLDPVLAYTESGKWPQTYCVHDLGASYPNATGHNDGGGENMPIEESANMLLMATAYMNFTDAASASAYAIRHYRIFKQWADYLVPNTLMPAFQNQTDDFTGFIANSSNLALKGILAVGAMGDIARYAGKANDQQYYSGQASSLITQWQGLSEDSSGLHLKLSYDMDGTWSLKYNAFPDKLLGLNLIPSSVLQQEAAWYTQQEQPYGIPLDIRHTYTKADWELWTAASTNDPLLRQDLVESLYDFANTTTSRVPLTDWYDTIGDTQNGFTARPVIGGLFSILARQDSGN
jgi:Domain of unknown function (DUF5127)/Domain of unknown function (DUF4965)/Domain of unknown function (DUF1793)/Concanavalin A-like lectin/glucanases superfamily/Domain of unknown function (DUF4964)